MTQESLKLFVSHSSKNDDNLALLKKVCDSLAQAGFDILVDKGGKIPIGEEWFRYLTEWMAECHVAVILFSSAAFEDSNWVRAEATILSWRKRLQPEFKLIGVLLDGLQPEQFDHDAYYRVIRINDFQQVRDFRSDDLENQITRIIDAIGKVDTQRLTPPFQEIARRGRDILNELKENPLKDAWNNLEDIDKPQWRPGMDYGDALARLLLRSPKKALTNLHNLLWELVHVLGKKRAGVLLDLYKGLWVSPQAACELCCHSDQNNSIAINCTEVEKFTGLTYARRAWPYPKSPKLISAGNSRTLNDIEGILLSYFESKSQFRYTLNPVLLVFPMLEHQESEIFPDASLLEELKILYPKVTVVVETGATIPYELDYLTPLHPLLESDEEKTQIICYYQIYELIESQI